MTKTRLLALVAALVLGMTRPTCGQSSELPATPPPPPLRVEGVFDNVYNFERLRQQTYDWSMNTSRTTVRAYATAGPVLDAKAGIVWRLHTGTHHVGNVPFLSPALRPTVVPADPSRGSAGAAPYMDNTVASAFYVQEAYATLHLGRAYVRAGRQKIQNGTGYGYNPTDIFNRHVPLDPTYEADGFDAVALGMALRPTITLEALAAPRGDGAYRARLQSARGSSLVALQFISLVRSRVDWEAVNTVAAVRALDAGTQTVDDFSSSTRWNQVSAEFSRTLGAVHVYGEFGVAFLARLPGAPVSGPGERTHERVLVGADYTFTSKVHVVGEYLRVGDGRGPSARLSVTDELAVAKGEILSADRNNAFVEISRPCAHKLTGTLKLLGMLDHPSVGINPWLYFDPRRNVRIAGSLYTYVGAARSAFNNVSIGAFTELRYSF